MSDDADLLATAYTASVSAVVATFPFFGLGTGVQEVLDLAATKAIEGVIAQSTSAHGIQVGAAEGPRDGVRAISLPRRPLATRALLYCDPIDGTLNAARGGPRSFSVVGLVRRNPGGWMDRLDDRTSVFFVGTRTGPTTLPHGWLGTLDHLEEQLANEHISVGTLNRTDNLSILFRSCRLEQADFAVGSKSGFRPTIQSSRCLAVGDATVTLPFECDLAFGRIGLVEARLEANLYKCWRGLIVSKTYMQSWPGGPIKYLRDYIDASQCGDISRLSCMFTLTERKRFQQAGVDIWTATRPLASGDFGLGRHGCAVIAALSGNRDPDLSGGREVIAGAKLMLGGEAVHVETISAIGATASRQAKIVMLDEIEGLPPVLRDWYDAR